MRPALIALLVPLVTLTAAGCGSHAAGTRRSVTVANVLAARMSRCDDGELLPLGSRASAYLAQAKHGAVAYRRPGSGELARFGATNVNDYPTVFGILGAVVAADCTPRWYRVQLPIRPNGALGYVRAADLAVQTVGTRIVVDVSDRRLTVYENGKPTLTATVAVGSPATPTPTGRYYVNQRLVPTDTNGPFGPGAIGISAYSNVLTGWTQGGPVAIHGTNEPWSIGKAASNGCIRLPNATLKKVFAVAYAGTPVIIKA